MTSARRQASHHLDPNGTPPRQCRQRALLRRAARLPVLASAPSSVRCGPAQPCSLRGPPRWPSTTSGKMSCCTVGQSAALSPLPRDRSPAGRNLGSSSPPGAQPAFRSPVAGRPGSKGDWHHRRTGVTSRCSRFPPQSGPCSIMPVALAPRKTRRPRNARSLTAYVRHGYFG